MKKIVLFGLALAALLSCGSQKGSKEVSLMSYNVGVFSKYQDNSMPGIAQLIRETGVSFVGMSELDSCNTRNNAFQVKDLAEMLEWDYAFARAIAYRGGAYGDGIVCAQPALKKVRVPLSQGDGAEARAICVVETEDCVFATTHLDHRSESAALAQMQEVNDWFAANYDGCKKPVCRQLCRSSQARVPGGRLQRVPGQRGHLPGSERLDAAFRYGPHFPVPESQPLH